MKNQDDQLNDSGPAAEILRCLDHITRYVIRAESFAKGLDSLGDGWVTPETMALVIDVLKGMGWEVNPPNTVSGETDNRATITEAEFAERVGLSRTTVYNLRRAGKLPHFKVGRRILYAPGHVTEFLTNAALGMTRQYTQPEPKPKKQPRSGEERLAAERKAAQEKTK